MLTLQMTRELIEQLADCAQVWGYPDAEAFACAVLEVHLLNNRRREPLSDPDPKEGEHERARHII